MYAPANQNDEVRKLRKLLECYIKDCNYDLLNTNSSENTGFDDAPTDGITYGRKNESWVPITLSNLFHNELGGKQGGDGTNFYHLSEDQYQGLDTLFSIVPHPEYISPTVNINVVNQILEVGSNSIGQVKSSFIRNDGGPLQSEKIFKNEIEVSATGIYNESEVIQEGETTYKSSATFLEGPIKENEIQVQDPIGRIQAGTVESETKIITGIIPWFWKSFAELPDISTLSLSTFNKVIGSSLETVKMDMDKNFTHIVVVVPSSSPEKNKWFVTEPSQGYIGNLSPINSPVLKTLSSPSNLWSGKDFNVYITNYQTSIKPTLELRNN